MAADAQAPKDLIGFLDFYLVKKAPFQIPDNAREWIVKFGPWIAVVLLVLWAPLVLAILGIGTVFLPFGGVGYATGFTTGALFLIAQVVLMALALPGLFARKVSGWRLLFYSQLLGIVASLLTGSFFGAIIGGLIGLYIVFQVRTLYAD